MIYGACVIRLYAKSSYLVHITLVEQQNGALQTVKALHHTLNIHNTVWSKLYMVDNHQDRMSFD